MSKSKKEKTYWAVMKKGTNKMLEVMTEDPIGEGYCLYGISVYAKKLDADMFKGSSESATLCKPEKNLEVRKVKILVV